MPITVSEFETGTVKMITAVKKEKKYTKDDFMKKALKIGKKCRVSSDDLLEYIRVTCESGVLPGPTDIDVLTHMDAFIHKRRYGDEDE